MKKCLTVILAVVLFCSLTGCSQLEALLGIETEPPVTADLSQLPGKLFEMTNYLEYSFWTADRGLSGPYIAIVKPEHLELGTFREAEAADVSRYDHWLEISAGNGQAKLTVYDGYRDLVRYEEDGTVLFYEDDDGKTLERLRIDFDVMEYEAGRQVAFPASGRPAGPLGDFAGSFYPASRKGLTVGSSFRFEEYDLIDYSVDAQTPLTITGTISYYASGPENAMPEDKEPGTGKYEGWFYCTEIVLLELDGEGIWHRVDAFAEQAPDEIENTDTA